MVGGDRKEELFTGAGDISSLGSGLEDGSGDGSTTVGTLGWGSGGKVTEDLGRVENFTGAKTLLLCPDPLCWDMYIGDEGELETVLRDI